MDGLSCPTTPSSIRLLFSNILFIIFFLIHVEELLTYSSGVARPDQGVGVGDKTFKVRGTSIVITITSYWYYNLIFLLKSPDYFATDVLLMIDWSMAMYDWSNIIIIITLNGLV